jgi:DNA ligase-1
MYPDIEKNILEVFKDVDSLIIEGEAVGLNPKTGAILPFQETVQRKRKYDIAEKAKDIPLRLIVFEILYLDGKDFINHKFEERRKILEKIFERKENKHLALSGVVWCGKPDEIEKKFKAAVNRNMEGVVAKRADGVYQAGARGWSWIKLKRGFQGQKLTDTIDCVVMGYDVGQGKRSGFGIGDFLIGIFNPKTEKFETVAKIGTGLTDEEWKKIKHDIDKIKVKEKPGNYSVAKGMNCDGWTAPKIVVEIMADEITKSPIHTAAGGLALRFPRLMRFRPDKSAKETTSVAEIEKMYKKQ